MPWSTAFLATGWADPFTPIVVTSSLSLRLVSFPPGVHLVRSLSDPAAMAAEYVSHTYPHAPQSSWAMAAIIRRAGGLPSASFIRSSIGSCGSCQGNSSCPAAGSVSCASGAPVPATAAGALTSPEKKPLSHARCSGLNGAASGIITAADISTPGPDR